MQIILKSCKSEFTKQPGVQPDIVENHFEYFNQTIWFDLIDLFGQFFIFLKAAQAIVNGDEKDEDLIKDVPELQNLEAETAHNK